MGPHFDQNVSAGEQSDPEVHVSEWADQNANIIFHLGGDRPETLEAGAGFAVTLLGSTHGRACEGLRRGQASWLVERRLDVPRDFAPALRSQGPASFERVCGVSVFGLIGPEEQFLTDSMVHTNLLRRSRGGLYVEEAPAGRATSGARAA